MSGPELFIAEVPWWRHAVAIVVLWGEGGGAPWCVRWRAASNDRSRILETFDSRYAAQQGLKRYEAILASDGDAGVREESAASRGPLAALRRRGHRRASERRGNDVE